MKLTPTPQKVRTDDTVGRGMDVALTVLLFFGIGFALDRWLGTTPWLMIGATMFAAIGQFVTTKVRYDATMARLEAERAARRADGAGRTAPAAGEQDGARSERATQ